MTQIHKGSCLCGAITFEIHGPLSDVINCHCSQCRKQTGHYYATTTVQSKDLKFTSPQADLSWYMASPNAKRGFCKQCGSALFWKDEPEKPYIAIMAGALDEPSGLETKAHIFCADKGDFYDITDDLPQHPQSSSSPIS